MGEWFNASAITASSTLMLRVVRAWVIEDLFCMDELYARRFIRTIAHRPTPETTPRNHNKSARFGEPVQR